MKLMSFGDSTVESSVKTDSSNEIVRNDSLTICGSSPFEATFPVGDGVLECSFNGESWFEVTPNKTVVVQDKVFVRGSGNSYLNTHGGATPFRFTSLANSKNLSDFEISCFGNIMTLLDYQSVLDGLEPEMRDDCFCALFYTCYNLVKAPDLTAMKLSKGCYNLMFFECKALKESPKLPAVEMSDWCYLDMFNGCTNLEKAPELSATKLAIGCYKGMFFGCEALKEAPKLPAIKMADRCYDAMFFGCSSLQETPELPATTLDVYCYNCMFCECTSLKKASDLPATEFKFGCYDSMFCRCDNLKELPKLPDVEMADQYYANLTDDRGIK